MKKKACNRTFQDRNLAPLLHSRSQAGNNEMYEFILGLPLVCFWNKQTKQKPPKQKPPQQIPTTNDLYKTSSLIEYWVILQLKEQKERVIIHLINCNNHEKNIQISFPQKIFKRIMEDCGWWLAQKNQVAAHLSSHADLWGSRETLLVD